MAASAYVADGRVDSDADTRTVSVRSARSSVSVEAVCPDIERRVREGASGREIARDLGLGRTRVCEIVREVRAASERFELVEETYPA
ncbi:hypothetical protein [Oerskovia enterophila]|uniref:hypothetical protein n=1 Tax=Oerskovia enterophila TaxID=43678 RepID=UPI0038234B1B